MEGALSDCSWDKSLGLDSFPYEQYYSIPYLFGHLLACVYTNWQENGRIPKSTSPGRFVTLPRKDPNKEDVIDHFRPITLFNTELKILAKVLERKG